MERSPIDPTLLEIRPLMRDDAELVQCFTSDDEDLDSFLRDDAMRLQEQSTVRTSVALYEGGLVGYVALLNDAVELKSKERKKLALAHHDHPMVSALKVARLAVSADFRALHRGTGEALVFYAYSKALLIAEHAGCRLLTVDAYPKAIGFYENLGFLRNQAERYAEKANVSMRFDLFNPNQAEWITNGSGEVS
jgi:ribosomal protein S18 acetylase RimI-like enzyme